MRSNHSQSLFFKDQQEWKSEDQKIERVNSQTCIPPCHRTCHATDKTTQVVMCPGSHRLTVTKRTRIISSFTATFNIFATQYTFSTILLVILKKKLFQRWNCWSFNAKKVAVKRPWGQAVKGPQMAAVFGGSGSEGLPGSGNPGAFHSLECAVS